MVRLRVFILVFLAFVSNVKTDQNLDEEIKDLKPLGRQLIEQGRTLVHHAVKRMMIILPAIFFKLGIAFTLLVVVTLVAVNNGFIGFLLLVVGLGSVLARLQEFRGPSHLPIQYVGPPALPASHHVLWDRNDVQDKMTYNNNNAYDNYHPKHNYAKYTTTNV